MALIFITGTSTSGKSTIARELVERGYKAYDTEHNGISAWFNKETGSRDAEFGQVPERTKVWFDAHEWRISIDWVQRIANSIPKQPIFLCGGAANENEVRAFCEQTIWLKTDELTIRTRVNNPRDHTYGTNPHELLDAIDTNKIKEQEYARTNAILIDVRRPINDVVDDILAATIHAN